MMEFLTLETGELVTLVVLVVVVLAAAVLGRRAQQSPAPPGAMGGDAQPSNDAASRRSR